MRGPSAGVARTIGGPGGLVSPDCLLYARTGANKADADHTIEISDPRLPLIDAPIIGEAGVDRMRRHAGVRYAGWAAHATATVRRTVLAAAACKRGGLT